MKDFYAGKLGLDVLEDFPQVLAVRAGDVRFSFFKSTDEIEKNNRIQIILRTDDIEAAKQKLVASGIPIEGDIIEAPNFMKFLTFADPDGNTVYIGQYLRNPLATL